VFSAVDLLDYLQIALAAPAAVAGVLLLQSVLLWPLGRRAARVLTWEMFGHSSDPRWRELGHYGSVFGLCVKVMRPAAVVCVLTWPPAILLAILAD
jgi:hypothetical protein